MKQIILSILFCLFLCGCPVQNDVVPAPEPTPIPAPPEPAPAPEPTPEPVPEPIPEPGPVILEPSEEMKSFVSKIEQVEDEELVEFYLAFSDLVSRDSEVIGSTGHIRTAHSRAGRLMFQQTGMKGKYPGLAVAIDEALMAALGKEDQKLTPELRRKAADIFTAIAWACQ